RVFPVDLRGICGGLCLRERAEPRQQAEDGECGGGAQEHRLAPDRHQFGDGCSMWSITMASPGSRCASSLRPSCSSSAVKMEGPVFVDGMQSPAPPWPPSGGLLEPISVSSGAHFRSTSY